MSVCASSAYGQKIRLNVLALIGEGTVGKVLICVDEDMMVQDLAMKVAASLAKSRIEGRLLRLLNFQKSHLPPDERVGDVLRDGEEVVAVLTQEPEDSATRQSFGRGNAMSFTHAPQEHVTAGPEAATASSPCHSVPSGPAVPTAADGLPGPVEVFEEDVRGTPGMALKKPQPAGKEHHRAHPLAVRQLAGDWEVEKLTPKLREYIVARFREVHDTPADPGRTYLTVSLKPRERPGAVVAPAPIHYSIARVDVIEFERLCGRKIQEVRGRLDFFGRCREALNSLLDRGAAREDYAPNMLPYRYRAEEDIGGLIHDADEGIFGQVEGFRPIILVDTSGALGENLLYVKAALKRMLYSFMVSKSRFNIVSFNSQGKAVAWEDRLVPPVAQKLREAEDFIESLTRAPRAGTDILEAMRWALEPSDADTVYLLTAGFPKRTDTAYVLADIRSRNLRQLPIHVIGVGCEARTELDLRRLAEESGASFRQKHFNMRASVNVSPQQLLLSRSSVSGSQKPGDERITIGGQVDILEVMIIEQEGQVTDWLEEQKCANRVLLSSATQQPVPDSDQARYAAGRLVVNSMCRGPQPFLRDMIEGGLSGYRGPGHGQTLPERAPRPMSANRATPRRGSAQPAQASRRAPSTGKGGGSYADDMRRPSVVNPWDRPSGIVKVSQITAGAASKGSFGMKNRPSSARR